MAQTPQNQLPGITETELWVLRATLTGCFRRDVELLLATFRGAAPDAR
ncbi:MAG: hypothetical protein WBM40_05990 [Thiohalocapsa sp.]